jgi:hypothetical protein
MKTLPNVVQLQSVQDPVVQKRSPTYVNANLDYEIIIDDHCGTNFHIAAGVRSGLRTRFLTTTWQRSTLRREKCSS